MPISRVGVQRGPDSVWDAARVLRLRRHLGLTQSAFAAELNARQQTVSEWETGRYQPRGVSTRLLALIAEEAHFSYKLRGAYHSFSNLRNPGC